MQRIVEYIVKETQIGKYFLEDIENHKEFEVGRRDQVAISVPMTVAVLELLFGRESLEIQKKAIQSLIKKLEENKNRLAFSMKEYLEVLKKL